MHVVNVLEFPLYRMAAMGLAEPYNWIYYATDNEFVIE